MEFNTKHKDDLISQPTILPKKYMNPGFGFGFPLGSSVSKGYLQDFHQFDQFLVDDLSSNLKFGTLPPYFDQFENLANRSSTNFNISSSMPLIEDGTMEKFQKRVFMNCSPRIAPEAIDQNMNYPSLNFREVVLPNLPFLPQQMSSIIAENMFRTTIGMKKKSSPIKKKSKVQKKTNVIKGPWSIEEDKLLTDLVRENGSKKWSEIAKMLQGRIGKQCRERWNNHLRPNIKKDNWKEEEEMILIESHAELGNKWAEIGKRLPGRSENSIKNHWNATRRRQISKQRCRNSTHQKSSSLLQSYIKNLTTTSNIANGGNNTSINTSMQIFNALGGPSIQPESFGFNAGDHLMPNYDFSNHLDLSFDPKMFPEIYNLGSTSDEIPGTSLVNEESLDMEMPFDMDSLLQGETKKDMDLVEMINQIMS
ncbi:hypothetical protein NE237_005613 [Protea cynaroides]|uniref:Uncharacterized protein n=1 Tax=Protea cynaroides TaxID=273540 RepID=A0A9Q0KL20_9MAGN|nr:hypothetical protein NE237_005613 [Protea cynaroides]